MKQLKTKLNKKSKRKCNLVFISIQFCVQENTQDPITYKDSRNILFHFFKGKTVQNQVVVFWRCLENYLFLQFCIRKLTSIPLPKEKIKHSGWTS